MQYKLKHIARLMSGITVRESLDTVSKGSYKLLKLSDLPKNTSTFDASGLTSIDWNAGSVQQKLKYQSIILFNRGKPTAYLFTGKEPDNVLVSHIFTIIDLHNKSILPEYLVWYLNHTDIAKNHFSKNQQGTNMLMTSIHTIQELPVVIPPILEQKEILMREHELSAEKELYTNYLKLKAEFTHAKNHQTLMQTLQTLQTIKY